jgi:hypothetical protein
MKPYEITEDIFIVGGPDISDRSDACVYLINLGDLVLIDSGAGWSVDTIINNINNLNLNTEKLKTHPSHPLPYRPYRRRPGNQKAAWGQNIHSHPRCTSP